MRDLYSDEIDLFALAGTLWRGKWVIIIFMLISLGIGGYYAFRVAVPIYPATATIVLNSSEQQVITDIEERLNKVFGFADVAA